MRKYLLIMAILSVITTRLAAQPPPGMGMAMGMGTQNWDNTQIASPEHVSGNVYRVVGGVIVNMAFSVGDDGIILVDSNFAALTEKIAAAIREVSEQPIRFLIDTHDHTDHAEGNENFGRAGAMIVAHDTVRTRLADLSQGPAASAALPVLTFAQGMSFHFNGEEIEVLHVAAGHTDGDVLVYFKGSNVIHMGDVFVGQYPIIDITRGGTYLGLIKTLNAAIVLVEPDTTIVPGHGPISERVDMIDYRDMLQDIYDRVAALHSAGQSLPAIIASRPSEDHDQRWAGGRGSESIIRAAYREVAGD
jgi:cyclase